MGVVLHLVLPRGNAIYAVLSTAHLGVPSAAETTGAGPLFSPGSPSGHLSLSYQGSQLIHFFIRPGDPFSQKPGEDVTPG